MDKELGRVLHENKWDSYFMNEKHESIRHKTRDFGINHPNGWAIVHVSRQMLVEGLLSGKYQLLP